MPELVQKSNSEDFFRAAAFVKTDDRTFPHLVYLFTKFRVEKEKVIKDLLEACIEAQVGLLEGNHNLTPKMKSVLLTLKRVISKHGSFYD